MRLAPRFDFLAHWRGLGRAAISQFQGESKWHLFYLSVLCIMGVVGFIVSPYHSKTRLAFFFMGIATYGAMVAFVNSPRRLWQALGLLALLGASVACFGATVTNWSIYKFSGISVFTQFIPQAPALFLALIGAPSGIHPNEIAGVLTLYAPPLLGYELFRARAAVHVKPLRWISIFNGLALSVMAIYLVLSLSRASILGLLVAAVLLLWQRRRAWGIAALGAIGLAALGVYVVLPHGTLDSFLSSALSTFNGTGETRTEIWRQAIEAIAKAPLTGIGLYNFGAIFRYNTYLPPDWPFPIMHAHNDFLQAALDLGLPGAIAYLLLLVDVEWHSFRTGRRLNGAAAGVCYGLGAAILAFGVFGLFDTLKLTAPISWLIWFVVGIAAATARMGDQLIAHDSPLG